MRPMITSPTRPTAALSLLNPLRSEQEGLEATEAYMRDLCRDGQRQDTPVARACLYHLEAGGGRTRARISLAAAHCLALQTDEAVIISAVPELLHNASLIHDDLQDRSEQRRGRASVWAQFGSGIAVCAGDLLVSAAYGAMASYPAPEKISALIKRVHARTRTVIEGQAADLACAGKPDISLAAYREIAAAKSGPLLGLGIELALIGSGYDEAAATAAKAAGAFALAYQIADDIEDDANDYDSHGGESCLNAVHLLRERGDADPLASARQQACHALLIAEESAGCLPEGAGAALTQAATELRGKLGAGT